MRRRTFPLPLAAAVAALVACSDSKDSTAPVSKIVNFSAILNGTSEVPANTSTGSGTFTATQVTATVNGDSLRKLLFAGRTYANIHTTAIGGGEIRGQIVKQ